MWTLQKPRSGWGRWTGWWTMLGAPGRALLLRVLRRARERQVGVSSLRGTDYVNTIPPESEPEFPGDERIERRLRAYNRWNAAVMVHRVQRPDIGIAPFVPGAWSSLGTDGVGLSDTRKALHRHFEVDAPSIVLRVLDQLIARQELDSSVRSKAIEIYQLDAVGGTVHQLLRFGCCW